MALYFAIEHRSHAKYDGAVWFVHPATVQDAMERAFEIRGAPEPAGDYYLDPQAPDHIFFGWPYRETMRAATQRGEFAGAGARSAGTTSSSTIACGAGQNEGTAIGSSSFRLPSSCLSCADSRREGRSARASCFRGPMGSMAPL